MRRYQKKPVQVYAAQLLGEEAFLRYTHPDHDFWKMAMKSRQVSFKKSANTEKLMFAEVDTLEGKIKANIGDWIIQGVEGEFYPCKDSVFKKTYEEATIELTD